ncbi:MAG TPA: DNA polymerase III subunit gamma/tau [Sphingobacterium sp.]|nr:DNA polymerase III subunit gamma/tau [Sphingobacterium sp.]
MSDFIVSARKYRPVTFDSVVGQKHITGTLKNAINNNQLAQAFLFCGPRGVGKTTCARILAKTINCENITAEIEACGECSSCKSFQQGTSMSIHELDAASNNSVEDIRTLIEQVRIPPQTGKYKIYIIDEVHMLSTAAFNAFLKTLEEPPSYAIFILATTEKHKILPTILSRCQIFDFNRIKVEDMAGHLEDIARKEQVQYEKDGLYMIAQKADGGLRDALSMFDQIVSFSDKKVTYRAVVDNLNVLDYDYYFKITDHIAQENVPDTLLVFDEIISGGFEGNHFISGLASHFRNLLISKEPKTVQLLEVSENIKKKYLEQSSALSTGLLLSALNIANHCEVNYRTSNNKRLQVELALMKMCHIASALLLSDKTIESPASEVKKKRLKTAEKESVETKPKAAETEKVEEKAVSFSTAKKNEENKAAAIAQQKPAVKQTLQEDAQKQPSVAAAATVQEKTTAKPGWGTVKSRLNVPDLNAIFEEKKEEETDEVKLVEGDLQQKIDPVAFKEKWRGFAERLRAENKITLYTIMTSGEPVLEGNVIKIGVENRIQEQELREGKIDILNYLRIELKNYSLDLKETMLEQERVRKPYTSKEKYQAMVTKNPKLDLLRRKFDLGLS